MPKTRLLREGGRERETEREREREREKREREHVVKIYVIAAKLL